MSRQLIRSLLRRRGYDIVQYPLPDWYHLRIGLAEILTSRRINCVIDVGANQGQYGEFLRNMGYEGRIVSFEPVGATFKKLQARAKRDKDWQIHQLAAGDAEQVLDINVSDTSEFSSLLPTSSYGQSRFSEGVAVHHTEQVKVARLDTMISEITQGIDDPRIYLTMDSQGYDLQVFAGASGCLPLVLGMQSEIALQQLYEGMPDYLTSLATYNSAGYSITSLIAVSRDESLSIIEFDCLMVRNSERKA